MSDEWLDFIASHLDIGKVYTRLVYRKVQEENIPESDLGDIILQIFCSKISEKIQDYNTAWYYSNPDEFFLN